MESIRFQFYNGKISDCKPAGWISLDRFIEAIRNPKPQVRAICDRVASYEAAGNMKAKKKEKESLHKFTPCVHIRDWRNYGNIVRFTGLMVLDFDHISHAPELKEFLFDEYKCIVATWLSPSRRGVKALVKIPVVQTVEEFKEYFYGISAELYDYEGYDTTPQNAVLDLFYSIDPALLFRPDAESWTEKGEIIKSISAVTIPAYKVEPSDHWQSRLSKMIEIGLCKINDNGHPQLRALAYAIGGYVASGYMSESDAVTEFWNRIPFHPYLKKGVDGYRKTAVWAIREGQKQPLNFN